MKKRQNLQKMDSQWHICRHFGDGMLQLVVFVSILLLSLDCVATVSNNATKENQSVPMVQRFIGSNTMRYSGFVDARVIKPNTAQYILGVKFKSGYSKPIDFILRPYNGKASIETYQPLYELNNGEDKRSFNITHKYYISLRIREASDDKFGATIKLFQRRKDLQVDINKPYRFKVSDFKLISDQLIQGEFNQVNEYLFIDRADLKFYLKLNVDIIFTEQEIVERFKQQTQ
jgi:hypothetical protein